MSTLSIAIATYNEQDNITRCLKSIHKIATEIIIVDGNSTDNTVNISNKFSKVRIISTDNKPIFHINKQIAIDACKSDWILQLDADEYVSPSLSKEISHIIKQNPKDISESGFWIKRQNYFLGKFLTKGGVYPDPTIRFYKKGKAKLPCLNVHEQAVVSGSVGILKNDLYHYADGSFSRYLARNNRYTTLIAQQLKDDRTAITFISFLKFYILKPIIRFLQIYIRHRGYIDGFPGFVFAFFSAMVYPIAFTKYYEHQINKSNIDLDKDWN